MAVAADLYITDDTLTLTPLEGVVVNIYDSVSTFVSSGTSGVDGHVALLLPAGIYEARAFKLGVVFSNPFRFEVLDPLPVGGTNTFDIEGAVTDLLPVAIDPRLCRCSGRFIGFSNDPKANVLVRISSKAEAGTQVPKLVDGNLVCVQDLSIRTDSNGYLFLDLLRTGEYYLMFAGEDEVAWNFKVPDRSSVNLVDLLFPQPVRLNWDQVVAPGNAVSVQVGQTVEVPLSVMFSDYLERAEGIWKVVTLDNSNPEVVNTAVSANNSKSTLTVVGVVVGTSSISASVIPGSIPDRVPAVTGILPALSVTVTP